MFFPLLALKHLPRSNSHLLTSLSSGHFLLYYLHYCYELRCSPDIWFPVIGTLCASSAQCLVMSPYHDSNIPAQKLMLAQIFLCNVFHTICVICSSLHSCLKAKEFSPLARFLPATSWTKCLFTGLPV